MLVEKLLYKGDKMISKIKYIVEYLNNHKDKLAHMLLGQIPAILIILVLGLNFETILISI